MGWAVVYSKGCGCRKPSVGAGLALGWLFVSLLDLEDIRLTNELLTLCPFLAFKATFQLGWVEIHRLYYFV